MMDLRCLYCGGKLYVALEAIGEGFEVPEAIECDSIECDARWEPDGTLLAAGYRKVSADPDTVERLANVIHDAIDQAAYDRRAVPQQRWADSESAARAVINAIGGQDG